MALTYTEISENCDYDSCNNKIPLNLKEAFRTTSFIRPQFVLIIQGLMNDVVNLTSYSNEMIYDLSKKALLFFNMLTEGLGDKIFLLAKGCSLDDVKQGSDKFPFYLNLRWLKRFIINFKFHILKNHNTNDFNLEHEFYT